ncbi:MAG: glycosyltransferase family 25 protein [Gammaproteobacteria bacterium]|nr:glycosyltransferase family 25 protein [Gammaproteobacteria bacterium]
MHSDKNHPWHCFVITLDHSQERRNLISARLDELGMPFEFYPGVDGRKVDLLSHQNYSKWKRRMFFGRDLSNGEFGCILAHKAIYEQIVKENIQATLILEDDAILCDELPDAVNALTRMPENWDLVRFLGREKNYRASRKIARLPGTQSHLARPHGTPGGAYGYVISNQAARRLLSMMEKNWLAIDTLHGVSWLTKLNTVSVIPSPVLPNDQVPSCIDEQDSNLRWDKSVQLSGWRKLVYPLTRGAWKTYSNVLIKYVWFGTLIPDRRLSRRLGKS